MSVRVLIVALAAASWSAFAPPTMAQVTAAPLAAEKAEYRLAAGDVIRISVYQNPDLQLEARLSEAGVISYPLLGAIRLGGNTITQAERLIADGLRNGNFVKQPQVSVLLVQVRGNQASVLGQVNRPGRVPIETAEMRLTDLLATAGGISSGGADIVTVVGVREGKPFRKEIDLPSLFRSAARDEDIAVRGGDAVFVDRAPMVYIYGEVQRAGVQRLERGMTVMQVLAAGGGLTQRGTDKGIRVHRKADDGRIEVLQPSLDDRVREGDVVYVRESLF